MPSTYTLNNGIELIGTGEQSGTWGDTTNTNLELLDTALDGQVTITATSAGSDASPNDLPISEGAVSNGRNRMIIITSATDLGADVYYQLTPNDAEKIIYVRNNLNAQDLILFQGTYNVSNAYTVPNGKTAIIFFDGAGTGAVAANVFNNAHFDALNIVGNVEIGGTLAVTSTSTFSDDVTLTGASYNVVWDKSDNALEFADNAKAVFGAGSDLQIYHDGTHSYVTDQGTGRLYLQGTANITLTNADGTAEYANFANGGAASLRYNGLVKFATTSTGVDVNGTLVSDSLTVDGVVDLNTSSVTIGDTSENSYLYFEDSDAVRTNYIGMVGSDNIEIAADDGNVGTDSSIRFRVDGNEIFRAEYSDTKPRLYLNTEVTSGVAAGWGGLFIGNNSVASSSNMIVFGETQTATQTNLPFISQTSSDGAAQDLSIGVHSADGAIRFWTGSSTSSEPYSTGNYNRVTIQSDGDIAFKNSDGSATGIFYDATNVRFGVGVGQTVDYDLHVAKNGATTVRLGQAASGDSTTLEIGKGFDATSAIHFVRGSDTDASIVVNTTEDLVLRYNKAGTSSKLKFTRGPSDTEVARFANTEGGGDNLYWNTTSLITSATTGTAAVISGDGAGVSHQFSRETTSTNASVMRLNDTGVGGKILDFLVDGDSKGGFGVLSGTNKFYMFDNSGTERMTMSAAGAFEFNTEGTVNDNFIIRSNDDGNGYAPDLVLERNSSTPADNDGIGSLQYRANNGLGSEVTFANVRASATDITSGTEDGGFFVSTQVGGADTMGFFLRNGKMGMNNASITGTFNDYTFEPDSLLELRNSTEAECRITFNKDEATKRQNYIGLYDDADTMAIAVDEDNIGTDSSLRLRVDAFTYAHFGSSDNSIEFNMKDGGFRLQRSVTTGVPVEFKTSNDSGQDYRVQIGGARTGITGDTSVISLRNFADQSTGGDYTFADLVGIDPVADATQKKGAFVVRTRSGTNMQSGLLIDETQRVILARRGGSGVYNGLPANVDSTTRCFIDQQDSGSAYHTLWVASDGGSGDPAITVSTSGSAYTPKCKIFGDGDIENVNNSYGTLASERRFKQDIVDATPQWDDIKALSWKKYRLKKDVEEMGDDAPVQLGLIIDELEQVSPNLVNSKEIYANREIPLLDKNGVQKTDEEGNLLTEQERYLEDTVKGYKTSVIFMKGMIALQEAMERIEQLEAEVAALKAQ